MGKGISMETVSPPRTLADRVEGRKSLESILADLIDGQSEAFVSGVAQAMRDAADKILGPIQSQLRVMSDEEAERFEKYETIKFGEHRGLKYGEVDVGYLDWVADKSLTLQAYLRSERAKRRPRADR